MSGHFSGSDVTLACAVIPAGGEGAETNLRGTVVVVTLVLVIERAVVFSADSGAAFTGGVVEASSDRVTLEFGTFVSAILT